MIEFFSKMRNNKKGFTLVELMVVVVILGILVAIAVPIYKSSTTTAKDNAIKANIRILDGAVSTYSANNTTSAAINVDSSNFSTSVLKDYLREWPSGPDGTVYKIEDGKATHTP